MASRVAFEQACSQADSIVLKSLDRKAFTAGWLGARWLKCTRYTEEAVWKVGDEAIDAFTNFRLNLLGTIDCVGHDLDARSPHLAGKGRRIPAEIRRPGRRPGGSYDLLRPGYSVLGGEGDGLDRGFKSAHL